MGGKKMKKETSLEGFKYYQRIGVKERKK